ncbi:S66 peptidase family protein [Tenacibaculum piscium]|uniref:S66 peptidase family protein n=1 Tax=Tenacibaculum piscium TaxID=1458515 RepID=UPI001EFBCA33|nr:LD-carboxypeptidase [Tenacibaculum piscium]MCG8183040.1 LD-carboxypeptidase [Tenacibaculum piscium]MCG8204776.1 LD-carboxypeptidase [Tenacibaculum piscium]
MKNIIILPFLLMISVAFSQTSTMNLITPPSLQKGDTIAIVAPAGILKNRKHVIDKAKKLAQSWGLKVVYGNNLFKQENHFSGTDEERCQDFQDALDNPNIKAIWAARGGYGSVRILDKLDFSKFIENPKWVIGYSDITAFHNHIHNLGIETIHGIMATSLQENPDKIAKSIASLKKILFGEKLSYQISASKYNRNIKNNQKFSGKLIGGNIAILASMLGSDSQLSTENKVLFIEEIGEYKYSIDRMLQSLKRAGYFTKVSGVIVGDMTKIKKNSTSWGSAIEQLILEVIPKDIPVIFNFPAGHEPDNRALIMGRKVAVTTQHKIVHLKFK